MFIVTEYAALTGTFTNSEETDEMLHNAAFHLVLHCL